MVILKSHVHKKNYIATVRAVKLLYKQYEMDISVSNLSKDPIFSGFLRSKAYKDIEQVNP